MSIRRKLATAVCTSALGISGLLVATPAHAATDNITVCNHSQSVDQIIAYIPNSPYSWIINQGTCSYVRDNYAGQYNVARVDVDRGGSGGEVDSWHKKKNSEGYGPCYNNETEASNPYSDSNGTTTTYATFSDTNCHN